jgi:hypothetical protein
MATKAFEHMSSWEEGLGGVGWEDRGSVSCYLSSVGRPFG